MDNEATTAVDSAATSSAPATTTPSTNSASGTRVPPLGECLHVQLAIAQSLSEAVYLQAKLTRPIVWIVDKNSS